MASSLQHQLAKRKVTLLAIRDQKATQEQYRLPTYAGGGSKKPKQHSSKESESNPSPSFQTSNGKVVGDRKAPNNRIHGGKHNYTQPKSAAYTMHHDHAAPEPGEGWTVVTRRKRAVPVSPEQRAAAFLREHRKKLLEEGQCFNCFNRGTGNFNVKVRLNAINVMQRAIIPGSVPKLCRRAPYINGGS